MCKLDRDFIKVIECLKKMLKVEVKCLQILNNCKLVVDWLKKNIKSKYFDSYFLIIYFFL